MPSSSLLQHNVRQYQPYTEADEERRQGLTQQITQDQAMQDRYNALNQPTVDLRGYDPNKSLGTASQIAGPGQAPGQAPGPQPQEAGGGGIMDFLRGIPGNVRDTVGQAMEDPTRRAMIAFGAKMMDTSHRFGEGLSYGTQIGRALQSGMDEYAAATDTKAPTVTVRKFMKGDEQWGTYGNWREEKWNDYGIPPHRIGAKDEEERPKFAAPNLDNYTKPTKKRYMDPKSPFYNRPEYLEELPFDYEGKKLEHKAGRAGTLEADKEYFPTKRAQAKIMKGMDLKFAKKLADYKSDESMRRFQREQEMRDRHGWGRPWHLPWVAKSLQHPPQRYPPGNYQEGFSRLCPSLRNQATSQLAHLAL